MGKQWYTSRLIWVGVISVVYGVMNLFGLAFDLSPGTLEIVLGVVVVILRAITNKEIVLK